MFLYFCGVIKIILTLRIKIMEVVVTKTYNVNKCNECPYFYEYVDTSVCFDTFDEPNYDQYCTHVDADNSGTTGAKYNEGSKKFIGGALSSFDKECPIPNWCPIKKKSCAKDCK